MPEPAFLWTSRRHFAPARRPGSPRMCLLACILAAALGSCGRGTAAGSTPVLGANPQEGAAIIQRDGCGSCHVIPGVANADGQVGPPLTQFARRTTIAGLLPNAPDPLVRWLRFPQAVVPGNAMPDTGLSEEQARDVAAYLYTLQ